LDEPDRRQLLSFTDPEVRPRQVFLLPELPIFVCLISA